MAHKFKKGQLVSYRIKINARETKKGFGHIQGRRSRHYLIKPNIGEGILRVYSNQVKEVAIPPTAMVVNEMPEKDVLAEKKENFDRALILEHIFALRERMDNYFFYTIVAMFLLAFIIVWVLSKWL